MLLLCSKFLFNFHHVIWYFAEVEYLAIFFSFRSAQIGINPSDPNPTKGNKN